MWLIGAGRTTVRRMTATPPLPTPPRAPAARSRRRVFGSLLLTMLLAIAAVVGCVALYAASTPGRTLDVRRDELAVGTPKFMPLTSLGAAGTRTHGVWVTLLADGSATALSSRNASAQCFIEWRAESVTPGGRGAYRDNCTGALFGPGGELAAGEAERAMDRYEVARLGTTLRINLDQLTLGTCAHGTQECSRAEAPVMRRGY